VTVPELLQDVIVRGAAFDIRPTETPTQLPGLMTKLHRNINRSIRSQVTRKSLYYDDPQGQVTLREEISLHYRYRDVQLSADEICITGGCQHSLLLALMATCKAGDNVAIESPGFYGVIQLLDKLGLHAIEIPSHSANGIAVDVLEEVLDKFDVTACVVSPCFSTPSGTCMSLEDKRRLIELANQHDLAVIEDDIYGDLSFEQPLAPIKSLDTQERVILCSSFSKSLSRDLRLGWIMAARWQSEIVRLSVLSHIANSQAIQTGLYWFMRDGDYNRYLYQFRHQLLRQKNQMEGALQRFWQNDIRFSHPKGGLSLWV
jgi:DNA-binding transcriptional MocR family regulator